MGLLDDAIREHLDLKRRRGADPTEVERAEREALGPVRRAPEEPAPSEAAAADEPVAFDQDEESEWHEPFDERGDDQIQTGVVSAEPPPPDFGEGHDPFAEDFAAAPPAGPEPFEPEHPESPHEVSSGEPEPLAFEEQPKRRGFLGRRKQQPTPEPEDHLDELDLDDDPFAEPDPATAPHPAEAPPPARGARPDAAAGGETVEYEVEEAFKAEGGEKEDEDVLEETPEFLQDTPDHDRLWFEQRPPRDFDFDG